MAQKRILLVGASRGLGLGLARRFAEEGWSVIGTQRNPGGALSAVPGVRVEQVDVTVPDQVDALHAHLAGTPLDVMFVVAGISGGPRQRVHEASSAEAARVFLTNAHAPLVLAERLADRLVPGGTTVFMTSGLGSVSNNTNGGWEVYRASKAALNTLARCFALRHPEQTVLLMHPGWVRTDMGGADAPLDVETSCEGMVRQVTAHLGQGGCTYLDYKGDTIAW